jgi:hypothetical protein
VVLNPTRIIEDAGLEFTEHEFEICCKQYQGGVGVHIRRGFMTGVQTLRFLCGRPIPTYLYRLLATHYRGFHDMKTSDRSDNSTKDRFSWSKCGMIVEHMTLVKVRIEIG